VNIPSNIWTLLIGIVLTLVSLWYGQNHGLLPEAASEEAPLVDNLFNMMMTISTGLFLIVQGALLIAAFRFRRRQGDDTDGPPVHGNIPLEILWTAIPTVIVLVLAIYSFEVYNAMGGFEPIPHSVAHAGHEKHIARMPGAAIAATLTDTENRNQEVSEQVNQDPATAEVRNQEIPQRRDAPLSGVTAPRIGPTPEKAGKPAGLLVNVSGMQYAWVFTYPDSGVTAGELHVPTGQQVKLIISANDVLHAFWVPQFRLKQDAIPGMQTELVFTPSKVGTYPINCAELCGAYHGAMRSQVIVETPEEFNNWIKEQQEVASSEALEQAVASNPGDMSAPEYLAPYAKEMGVNAETLHHLHR
jgi:cytochrome c oxidase subunit 2